MPPDNRALLRALRDVLRHDVHWRRMPSDEWPSSIKSPLTDAVLSAHLRGDCAAGAAFILPGESTTRVGLLDFDSHGGEVPWEGMVAAAGEVKALLDALDIPSLPFRSAGGRGIHLWTIWKTPQDAHSVRQMYQTVLTACGLTNGTAGVAEGQVEIFPKQDRVPVGRFGNMAILPLTGKSVALDEDLTVRQSTAGVEWEFASPVPFVPGPLPRVSAPTVTDGGILLESALRSIPNDDDPLCYDDWRNVIFAVHAATGGSDEGLALAHAFSGRSGKYDPDFLDTRVWPYITDRPDGIGANYVYDLAETHGWIVRYVAEFDALDESNPPEEAPPAGTLPVAGLAAPSRFAPIQAAEYAAKTTSARWAIKHLLPAGGTSVLYGPSGSGKSFLSLDLMFAVARGEDWRDLRTTQGRVVYVAAEGAEGVRLRIQAYAAQHGIDMAEVDLWVIPDSPNLLAPEDVKELIGAIKGMGGCDYLVLDTLAQTLAGADENSSKDMGQAIAHCRVIEKKLGAGVLLVHHSGKDESRGARGWSGLRAAVDAELEVSRFGDLRTLTVSKQKDGVDGAEYGFKLLPVVLGEDEDGDDITSCVVAACEVPNEAEKTRAKPLGKREREAWKVVLDHLEGAEDAGSADQEAVLQALADQSPPPVTGRDRRREMAKRTLTRLEDTGRITSDGVRVYVPAGARGEEVLQE